MPVAYVFVYLQLLDFLTTLAGLHVGAKEASPFIANLIHASSPLAGVAASKVLALGLGGLCVLLDKVRLIGIINYWFAALIVWNLCVLSHVGVVVLHH